MKNFVLKYGIIIVNITAFLTLAGLAVSTFNVFNAQGVWSAIVSLWLGIVSFVFIFFHIYLTISINENLKEIKEKML